MKYLGKDIGNKCALAAAAMLALCACHHRPSYVLSPDELAPVMADIHTAEAVVENDYHSFPTDSSRLALKQAILESHGISSETFDTSLVWYGHNIDKYLELYDKTIEVLNARIDNAGIEAQQVAISLAGDSVDIWAGPRSLALSDRLPSHMISFDIPADSNWMPGDAVTMKAKLHIGNATPSVRWVYMANYDDGYAEMMDFKETPMNDWAQSTFYTDSTRRLVRLRGGFESEADNGAEIWIDSISLLRRRGSEAARYSYRQRLFKPY